LTEPQKHWEFGSVQVLVALQEAWAGIAFLL